MLIFLFANQIIGLGKERSFYRLSVENGLSNNQVKTIFKDSNGFIWFGTLEGLDRYDGVEIRPYSSKFPVTVENVYAVAEDSEKKLWVGTATGLFRYNSSNDRFERINLDSSVVSVHALALMPDSTLMIGTANGLYRINPKTRKSEHLIYTDSPSSKSNYITGIITDYHGNCWLSTLSGLIRYAAGTGKIDLFLFRKTPEEGYNSFTSLCCIGNKIYLGTSYLGLVEFDLAGKTFSTGIPTENNFILTLSSDNKERLFAGTDGGGLKVINVRNRLVESIENDVNDPESITSNSVYAFCLDEYNRYWIGTYSGGVNYSKSIAGYFKLYPLASNLGEINKSIRSFYFAPDGTSYFGTRNGLLQMDRDGKAKLFQANSNDKSGLRSNIILAVYPYNDDILIGTYGGGVSLFSVKEQRIKPFVSDVFLQGNTYGFETDQSGHLWIATFNGIYRYSPGDKSLINFNKQNSGIKSNEIFDIAFDSGGRLWLGTMNGPIVLSVSGAKAEVIPLPAEVDNNYKVNYIYEDQAGNIWICNERGGLIMDSQDLKSSKGYRTADGLPDNSVCAIVESSAGEYWISTLKGFCLYSARDNRFKKFSLSDGLPGLVFTPAATYQAPDGTIYFGNENGLICFSPSQVVASNITSTIKITDFYLLGKEVKPGPKTVLSSIIEETKEIRLKDRQNSIGFRFVSLNYINASDNDYQYQLEGYDKEWRNNGSNNTVFYEKLKPGDYIFRVRNTREANQNSANSMMLRLHISRSFFSTVWFWGFLLILGAAIFVIQLQYFQRLKTEVSSSAEMPKEKYKGSKIAVPQSIAISKELKRLMEEKKPYLNAELKLADLSREIGYSVHDISQVLNHDLNQSFNDFVNRYRVDEVKARLEDQDYGKYTIFALAQQCGFNSKTSFYRIFKNETGKTPVDYVRDLKRS